MSTGIKLTSKIIKDKSIDLLYHEKIDDDDYDIVEYFLSSWLHLIKKKHASPAFNLMLKDYSYIVLRDNLTIVGITAWEIVNPTTIRSKLIKVNPEFERNGLFKLMRETQFDLFRSQNKTHVLGSAAIKNIKAITAHIKLGYHIIETYPKFVIFYKKL